MSSGPGRAVLVVGEDEELAQLAQALTAAAWSVSLVTSSFGTLGLAHETAPDAIVLDLRLPFRSGVSLLLGLRADASLRHVPVIVVSPDPAALPGPVAAMVEEVLPLPPDPTAIVDALDKLCTGEARKGPSEAGRFRGAVAKTPKRSRHS